MPRNVWVLSLSSFFIMVGFGVVLPVLPIFARSFGASTFATSAIVSAFATARLLSSPLSVPLISRWGQRSCLIIGTLIVAASSAAIGLSHNYWQMLISRATAGIGSAIFTVAAMDVLVSSVSPTQRGRATAIYSGSFLIGGMAGPALGGLLASISIRAPFFFYSFTLLFSAAAVGFLLTKTTYATSAKTTESSSLTSFLKQARFRSAIAANFATGWQAQGVRSALVPIIIVEIIHADPTMTGTAFTIAMIIQAISLGPAGRFTDSAGRKAVLIVSLILGGIASVIIAGAHSYLMIVGGLSLFAISSAGMSTAPAAIVADVCAGKARSGLAAFQMALDLGSIIGPLIAGLLADQISMWAAMSIGGLIYIVLALASYRVRLNPDMS